MAGESKSDRKAYAAISVPFFVVAVVYFTTGKAGLGAAFLAIAVTFSALSAARGDARDEDGGNERDAG